MPDSTLDEEESRQVERLAEVSTPRIADALSRLDVRNVVPDGVEPLSRGTDVAGPARTLRFLPETGRSPTESIDLMTAIDDVLPGTVLVFECPARGATFGSIATKTAIRQDVRALVTGGQIRDYEDVVESELSVFLPTGSVTPTAYKGKLEIVAVDVPVNLRGARVNPGDVVFGDRNGVVVVPRGSLERVAEMADEIATYERSIETRVANGTSWSAIRSEFKSE